MARPQGGDLRQVPLRICVVSGKVVTGICQDAGEHCKHLNVRKLLKMLKDSLDEPCVSERVVAPFQVPPKVWMHDGAGLVKGQIKC